MNLNKTLAPIIKTLHQHSFLFLFTVLLLVTFNGMVIGKNYTESKFCKENICLENTQENKDGLDWYELENDMSFTRVK